MNENEFERYEAELRGIAPAPLPENFMARLQAAKPDMEPARRTQLQPAAGSLWLADLLRWLAPVTALAVLGLLAFRPALMPASGVKVRPLAVASGFKADDVQMDENLVSSFDVIATLPDGQPMRFHCRQWTDQLVATDSNHGVKIEQSNPRVEVVPVRFETY